jgi:alpha-L-fucosidase
MLIDIVSKNGNLMLSIPVRGDGTIDEDELKVVEGIAAWMGLNGEGIFGTRPWRVYGEGPSVTSPGPRGQFGGARDVRPYTSDDIRFTVKGDVLYAFAMAWPANGTLTIKSLAQGSADFPRGIARVDLLGTRGPLVFVRDASGLVVNLPAAKPDDPAHTLRITPK